MKRVKSVAFNVADPMELALYKHAEKHKYFSTYIKRLIQRDLEHGTQQDIEQYYEASKYFDTKKEDTGE